MWNPGCVLCMCVRECAHAGRGRRSRSMNICLVKTSGFPWSKWNPSPMPPDHRVPRPRIPWSPCQAQAKLWVAMWQPICVYVFKDIFILFISWLCWVFFAVHRSSPIALEQGLLCSCPEWASHCCGFSLWRKGFSHCGSWALAHRLSSCHAQAELLRGIWDLPGPGIEPVALALAGGFFTTEPPGNPACVFFKN